MEHIDCKEAINAYWDFIKEMDITAKFKEYLILKNIDFSIIPDRNARKNKL